MPLTWLTSCVMLRHPVPTMQDAPPFRQPRRERGSSSTSITGLETVPARNFQGVDRKRNQARARDANVRPGELSRARHVVSAAELAAGNDATWQALMDPARQPPQSLAPAELLAFQKVPDSSPINRLGSPPHCVRRERRRGHRG